MKEQTIDQSTILHDLENAGGYDSEGSFRWVDVTGVKTKVYTKYFTGTTDADGVTNVVHGQDWDKILLMTLHIKCSDGFYGGYELYYGASSPYGVRFFWFATEMYLYHESKFQSQPYRIRLDYTL